MQTKLSAPTAMADTARDITRRRARWPWVAGAVACLAFALLQFFVERRAFSSWVHFPGGSRRFEVDWPTIRYAFAGDLARYLGLSLAGITLVFRGRRKLFWVQRSPTWVLLCCSSGAITTASSSAAYLRRSARAGVRSARGVTAVSRRGGGQPCSSSHSSWSQPWPSR
jgi:hypothetical protein